MTTKIGWSMTRPRERKPGQIGGGIWLLQILNLRKGQGTKIVVGTLNLRREDLEQLRERGQKLDVWVLGVLTFARDVKPALVKDTIRSATSLGKLRASPEIKRALVDR